MKVLCEPVAVREEFYLMLWQSLEFIPGREDKMLRLKSEDLPIMVTVDHVELVSAEYADILRLLFVLREALI